MLLVLCLRWKGQWQTTVMSLTQLVHPAPLYCQTVDSGYITEVDAIVSVFAMLQPFAHSYYCPGVMQFSFLLMLSQKADEEERPQVKQEVADKPSSSDTSWEMPHQETLEEISGDREEEEAVQQEQEEQEHSSEEVKVQTKETSDISWDLEEEVEHEQSEVSHEGEEEVQLDQDSEEMSGEMEDEMPQQETSEEPSAFTFTASSTDMKRLICGRMPRGLVDGWTKLMYQQFNAIYPFCALAFYYNHCRKSQSRKTTSPFWVGRARYRTGNCTEVCIICMINIHVQFFYV